MDAIVPEGVNDPLEVTGDCAALLSNATALPDPVLTPPTKPFACAKFPVEVTLIVPAEPTNAGAIFGKPDCAIVTF